MKIGIYILFEQKICTVLISASLWCVRGYMWTRLEAWGPWPTLIMLQSPEPDPGSPACDSWPFQGNIHPPLGLGKYYVRNCRSIHILTFLASKNTLTKLLSWLYSCSLLLQYLKDLKIVQSKLTSLHTYHL